MKHIPLSCLFRTIQILLWIQIEETSTTILPTSTTLQKYSIAEVKQNKTTLPTGCDDYKLLTNPNRKTTFSSQIMEQWKCDKSGSSGTSPDWQGPGWYRISPSIGTKIPTSPTKQYHCGHQASGWISGGSTPGLGQMIDAKACFSWAGDNCYRKINVRIRNCKDYFLYFLPDIPDCYASYCVE